MIKNRTTQLIFETVYCTLGLVGCIASLGIFDDISNFRWDFYVHFTNISNFFCIGVMVTALIQTIKKKEDSYVSACPVFKFMGMLGILLTFLVFNILLAGAEGRNPQLNWRISSLSFHVVLPIMYIIHWILFYERKKVKWNYPLLSILFPLVYVVFIFIQAAILKFDTSILIPNSTTPLIYPYFFLNIETQGIKVLIWIFALLAGFVGLGYGFYGLDKVIKTKSK
jgi:hypothetical protein